MFKFVLIASLLVSVAFAAPPQDADDAAERAELERIQNESAQYSFDSGIKDGINDGIFDREESRDGQKILDKYSTSDGYGMRTVHYLVDENGYRVVKEEVEIIGEGPVFNSEGQADVQGSLFGKYSIMLNSDDSDKHFKDIRA
ncbi:uncharacterized protein LOC117783910 [Drosophila innubila]|uniref:uncharacterized protein LOC117783910 n=1 Tax=Drosophila innubila TaxID=198719 RepID=UPI00148CBC00|nr:uncharacterized protein LOC117783910 [Drosophila innubila]